MNKEQLNEEKLLGELTYEILGVPMFEKTPSIFIGKVSIIVN